MKSALILGICYLGLHAVFAASPVPAGPPVYIDVRTPSEYESGHLAGAYNINFDSIGRHIHTITADKDAPIVLYCKSGRRSGLAKETLEQMGYSNVTNAGGINDVLREASGTAVTGPECRPTDC